MHEEVALKWVISSNINYYTSVWGTALFWASIPIALVSYETGKTIFTGAILLLGAQLLNNKISTGKWLN